MVDIYLNLEGSQLAFLSVPNSDVQRLSIHPFSWLRYVMFSICGARGDLSATLDGPPVNYRSTELADVPYYYTPSGNCIFVDHQGLNDKITSTSQTTRRNDFRRDVIRRDGQFCVITRGPRVACDAVHLIPRSKGDEYIARVVQDRSPLYPSSPPISGINDVQNGMLLKSDLHRLLAVGILALLKTPNYGLEPGDIKRVDLGPPRLDHITLQQLKCDYDNPDKLERLRSLGDLDPIPAFSYGANLDAVFQGDTGRPLPPAVILDYVYGVAAYNCWSARQGDHDVHALMKSYRREHYIDIPLPHRPPISDDGDSYEEEDDTKDPDHIPSSSAEERDDALGHDYPSPTSLQRRPHMSIRRGDAMAAAMDNLNSVLMSLQGITPEEAANRREKRMEEEELKARKASRSKVMEWRKKTMARGSDIALKENERPS